MQRRFSFGALYRPRNVGGSASRKAISVNGGRDVC